MSITVSGGTAPSGIPKRGAYVYNNGTVSMSILHGVLTTVEWTTERWDYGGFWEAANPTRLTIPVAGIYKIISQVGWAAAANNTIRTSLFRINGATDIAQDSRTGNTGDPIFITTSTIWEFVLNDYLELRLYQESTVGLNANADLTTPSFLSVILLQS